MYKSPKGGRGGQGGLWIGWMAHGKHTQVYYLQELVSPGRLVSEDQSVKPQMLKHQKDTLNRVISFGNMVLAETSLVKMRSYWRHILQCSRK